MQIQGNTYSASKGKASINKAQKESVPQLGRSGNSRKMGPLQDQIVEDVSTSEPHPTDPKGQLAESTEPIVENVDEKTPGEALDAPHPKNRPSQKTLSYLNTL
ncbi:MAG: hypothetical protein H6925_00990 [Holosporaceae bacterium]|nr:MAG: hypothetical protein H6925_00990 [Holosporaceae bacterium]